MTDSLNTTDEYFLKWQPISDFDEPADELLDSELHALAEIWFDRKKELSDLDSFSLFTERLSREWAIETGLIERLYVLDQGLTQTLILDGLNANVLSADVTANPQQTIQVIRDQEEALEAVFDFVKGRRPLSTSYIKELHHCLTQHQDTCEAVDQFGVVRDIPLIKGDYKKTPNDPTRPDGLIHEYCPPEQVSLEMEKLIALHAEHDRATVAPEVEAAWLHHRFTSIHPFQDGNGRVARCLASFVFIKAGWFPLVVRDKDRMEYLNALEKADAESLGPLVLFFAEQQKVCLLNALQIAEDVEPLTELDEAIQKTGERLKINKTALATERERVCNVAQKLHEHTIQRLQEVARKLSEELGSVLPDSSFDTDEETNNGPRTQYFRKEILEIAKQLNYFADTRTYCSWVKLSLRDGIDGVLLLAFHSLGQNFVGLLACSPFWLERVQVEDGRYASVQTIPLANDLFRINYRENLDTSIKRFDPWLDACIVEGIAHFEASRL